ncbi:hypothetical protein [Micromonospora zamorensis]|uniref:hypothetical protein n=1 Tax=Micromonospora zamorensis TaxID=709883 RepID=UPI003409FB6A
MGRNWFSSRWAAVVVGLLVGAMAGLAVYQGSRLTGQSLFVLCGTTAGGVAAIVVHGYARNVQLTEVTVSVPQFSDLHFAVTADNKQVAWRLFVETVTRVSVQPLMEGTGLIREAMNSLYALFATTREILTQTQPSRRAGKTPTVEHLAIAMLNNEIRPFLSRWHPQLLHWAQENKSLPESAWPDAAECRSELTAMQERLSRYAIGFGELAGLPEATEVMVGNLGPTFDAPQQRSAYGRNAGGKI